jgi:hypothetical protein
MSDKKMSGRRLIGSEVRTAKITHHCVNGLPECGCSTIFPGDSYVKEVFVSSLFWYRSSTI